MTRVMFIAALMLTIINLASLPRSFNAITTRAEPAAIKLTTDYQIFRTEPLEIKLRIVSRAQWVKEMPIIGADGFTAYLMNPCEITIPEGWVIETSTLRGLAAWKERDNGDTLAHEILHCLHGAWHPAWNAIKNRSDSADWVELFKLRQQTEAKQNQITTKPKQQ